MRLGLVILLCVLCASAAAQLSRTTGTIQGTVKDMTGAAIPGAQITIRNVETNQARTTPTDDHGHFRIAELVPGPYQVAVERSGFAPYHRTGVELVISQTVDLAIELKPAATTTEVTVSGEAPALDPTQTTVTSTVETEKIEELPVRSRNYLEFVLLAPGVAAVNPQQNSNSTAFTTSGFVFGGLRPRSNNLSIDGLDNNDEFTGSSRNELSLETIREFQVVNNGLSAEAGGASGGSINVVTKSGTNRWHGDAFIFVQNGALNAKPPLENVPEKPDLTRYRAGVALGGPIIRDRTFFYVAGEQEHTRTQAASDIDPVTAAAINAVLASGAFPALSTRHITTGFFPVALAETEASGKLDHRFNNRHSLMLRYAFTNNREANDAFNTGGLSDFTARGSGFTRDQGLAGSLVSLLGADRVNDLRFQVADRRVVLRTADQSGSGISIAGLADFGRPYGGNSERREDHYELSDTFSYARGRHLIKAGITVNHIRLSANVGDGFGGLYIFGSLADFAAGNPDLFLQAFGDPRTIFGVTAYGGYMQEHWTATSRLTLDLGLRYDFEHLPFLFSQDTNNFSPRIGVAYSPWNSWVVRAGYGIFFDREVLANLNRALEKDGVHGFEQFLDGPAAALTFQQNGGGAVNAPSLLPPSVYRPQPGLPTPYSQQANLSIEHLLASNMTATASYLFVRGIQLPRTVNVNLLPPVLLTTASAPAFGILNPTPQQLGREVFPPSRLNPLFTDIYHLQDAAGSTYHGLLLTMTRRVSHEIGFSGSYTVSKTIDDGSDFQEQPQNPYDLRAERALSLNHQAQRFVFSGVFDLPFGEDEEGERKEEGPLASALANISLNPIVTINSGNPVNPLTGLDSNRSHAFPLSSRPLGLARDSLRLPTFAMVDLRVVKFLLLGERRRLDFVAEFFNLMNHRNVIQLDPVFGSGLGPQPGFALPIEAVNPRQVQFSLDFEF